VTLEAAQFLIGTWRGTGRGIYPTITGFDYSEEITFTTIPGKGFLVYTQKTMVDGAPSHTEAGYLRLPGPGLAELVIAMPTGVVEVHTGTLTGTSLELRSMVVGLTPTAKKVNSVARRIEVTGDTLSYDLDMAAVGQPEQLHLRASLERVP
jgi:hypothetical protein